MKNQINASGTRYAGNSTTKRNYCFIGLSKVIFLLLLLLPSKVYLGPSKSVFTQVPKIVSCGPSSNNIEQAAILDQFGASQQYSIWGWYQFSGTATANSNILVLRNLGSSNSGNQAAFNSNYPACPYTMLELSRNPSFLKLPSVSINPNCFLGKSIIPPADLLYINFNFNPSDGTQPPKFDLIFLIQNGILNGTSVMNLQGYTGQSFVPNAWTFFAVSLDYVQGTGALFYQIFDGSSSPGFSQQIALSFTGFAITPNLQLNIASVQPNLYYKYSCPFSGQIGFVEIGLFYTSKPNLLWMGYTPPSNMAVSGINSQIMFNRNDDGPLVDISNNLEYEIHGGCSNIYSNENSKTGVNFYSNSSVPLTNFQCSPVQKSVQSITFFLQFSYCEPLPQNFVIVQKGIQGQSNFMSISLQKNQSGGRNILVLLTNANGSITWLSPTIFSPSVIYSVLVGVTSDLAGGLYVVYLDTNTSNYSLLKPNFNFDFTIDKGVNMLCLFNNKATSNYNGYFSFYRFIFLNSASAAIYNSLLISNQINKNVNQTVSPSNKCLVGSSYYSQSNYCLICPQNQIATLNGGCVLNCPPGQSTFGSNVCLPCADLSCCKPGVIISNNTCDNITNPVNGTNNTIQAAFDPLFWTFLQLNSTDYVLIPSKPVLNVNTNPYQLINVNITGRPNTSYTLTNDLALQWINLRVNLQNGTYYNENVTLTINNSNFKNLTNGTIPKWYYYPNTFASNNGTLPFTIFQICNLDSNVVTSMNALAITILCLFAFCFLFLLCLTCCCWNSTDDLGGLWKYFLHCVIRLNFVAFLILLGIHIPCCVKQFLNILYLIMVRWDGVLGEVINNINSGNANYLSGLYTQARFQFFQEMGVYAFILHNMMISFIVHLFIFLIYIIVMIWDCLISSRGRCMYYTYIFMHFTVVIVGYGLVNMHAWVFAAINIRSAIFTHSYFVICFIIAVIYIGVFVFFWIYAAYRLFGSALYFLNEVYYANFYYFFAGYRENKTARTYDLFFWLAFFIIGLVIGFLYDQPLAEMIIILSVLVVLFLISIILRPWRYIFQFIVELIAQLFLIIAVALLLVIAIYDQTSCFLCGTREDSLCWAIVAFLFLAMILPILALLLQGMFLACCPTKYQRFGSSKNRYIGNEAYYGYSFGQQNMITNVNENVITERHVQNYGFQKDGVEERVFETTNQRLLTADGQEICKCCNQLIKNCQIHNRVAIEQNVETYDAKRSMIDFMNELRAKRNANNEKVIELETRNNLTNIEDNIDAVEMRSKSPSIYRRANMLNDDHIDEEFKQKRVLNALENTNKSGFVDRNQVYTQVLRSGDSYSQGTDEFAQNMKVNETSANFGTGGTRNRSITRTVNNTSYESKNMKRGFD